MAFWKRCHKCGTRGATSGPSVFYPAGSKKRGCYCGQCWSDVMRGLFAR